MQRSAELLHVTLPFLSFLDFRGTQGVSIVGYVYFYDIRGAYLDSYNKPHHLRLP